MEIIVKSIDKDNYITLEVKTGNNWCNYFIDNLKELHFVNGVVNGVKLRNDGIFNLGFEKDGKKGRLNWCIEDMKKINQYVYDNYLNVIKNIK